MTPFNPALLENGIAVAALLLSFYSCAAVSAWFYIFSLWRMAACIRGECGRRPFFYSD